MKLFTYGSLRRAQYNHHILLSVGGKFLSEAQLKADVVPTSYPFPALKEGLGLAIGEVYEVSPEALERLDSFEGNPTFYQRRTTVTTDGIEVEAYFGTGVIGLQPQA